MPKRNATTPSKKEELQRRWQVIRGLIWVAAVVLAAVIVWALLVPGTDWLARHDIGSSKGSLAAARDAARGRLLTLGAGLLAAGALVFTGRTFILSRRTYGLTEQGQVTDRYTKAIDQLGSDKLDVRIGGIYALERIARDSAKDHPAAMEVLTAFIRDHSHEPWPVTGRGVQDGEKKTRPDVQAAVTVVGRRDAERDIEPIDLTGADLTGADLAGATLHGRPRQARNDELEIELPGAILRGAILRGADFTWARLFNADLTHANLVGAHLTRASLLIAFLDGADLTDAGLIGADLTRAFLRGADLTRARLFAARVTRADLIDLGLSDPYLTGPGSHADLSDPYLTEADIRVSYPDLTDADLIGAGLTDAELTGADLTHARWPTAMVPRGWTIDGGDSDRLKRAGGLSKVMPRYLR